MLGPHKKWKSALERIVVDVDAALSSVYPEKHLWKVSELDQARLTKLLVWSERYGVPVAYILETLLDHYYSNLPKLSRDRARKSKGLGVRVATLTGDVSLSILRSAIIRDFPEGSCLAAHKEREKERIADLMDESIPKKPKRVLDYPSLEAFTDAYVRKIEVRRKGVQRIETKMKKLAWRNNPWR
jgi:hypothetical protein